LVAPIFDKAAIPHFPTEDDAVRAFMHLVKHREAMEALMDTPPSVSSLFAPDVNAARKIVADTLKEGRAWLDPIDLGFVPRQRIVKGGRQCLRLGYQRLRLLI
jgi:acetyltransferase